MMDGLTSAEQRFTAFVSIFIRDLDAEIFEGAPTFTPYTEAALNRTPYVTISHTGIIEEGRFLPAVSDYDDALSLIKYQIEKYCRGARRIVIRQWPHISCSVDHATQRQLFRTRVRLLADDGSAPLATSTSVPNIKRECAVTRRRTMADAGNGEKIKPQPHGLYGLASATYNHFLWCDLSIFYNCEPGIQLRTCLRGYNVQLMDNSMPNKDGFSPYAVLEGASEQWLQMLRDAVQYHMKYEHWQKYGSAA